eukprot:5940816-Pyramimonas_sp.AAC.2
MTSFQNKRPVKLAKTETPIQIEEEVTYSDITFTGAPVDAPWGAVPRALVPCLALRAGVLPLVIPSPARPGVGDRGLVPDLVAETLDRTLTAQMRAEEEVNLL